MAHGAKSKGKELKAYGARQRAEGIEHRAWRIGHGA